MKEQFVNHDFTDWIDLMMKDGTQQNHFVQVSGAGENVSYNIGMGYQKKMASWGMDSIDTT